MEDNYVVSSFIDLNLRDEWGQNASALKRDDWDAHLDERQVDVSAEGGRR
jgi:hypothetical protein